MISEKLEETFGSNGMGSSFNERMEFDALNSTNKNLSKESVTNQRGGQKFGSNDKLKNVTRDKK